MSCFKKTKYQIHPTPATIHSITVALPSHKITDVNTELCDLLLYNRTEMVGRLVHYFTTPILNQYVLEHFEKYKNAEIIDLYKAAQKLNKTISKLRFFPCMKKDDTLLWVQLNPSLFIHETSVYIFMKIHVYDDNMKIAPNIPQKFLNAIDFEPKMIVEEFNDVIIVMLDIYGSTELAMKKTPLEMAHIYHMVIKKSMHIIHQEFYPFLQFVEACGDSLMFINAPELMMTMQHMATETLYFVVRLIKVLNQFLSTHGVYVRCGITQGNICGGVIDGKTMRWFGLPVHKAARLESVCSKNQVVIDSTIKCRLEREECDFKEYEMREESKLLKGIGPCDIYHLKPIPSNDISPNRPDKPMFRRSSRDFVFEDHSPKN